MSAKKKSVRLAIEGGVRQSPNPATTAPNILLSRAGPPPPARRGPRSIWNNIRTQRSASYAAERVRGGEVLGAGSCFTVTEPPTLSAHIATANRGRTARPHYGLRESPRLTPARTSARSHRAERRLLARSWGRWIADRETASRLSRADRHDDATALRGELCATST